ncbi:MAG TPA: sigma-70 family RNA polymerase sigma factor [Gemmataceae bacterium]|jgi:RNA polymerase sigma factor (sigma-70 family)
MAKARLAGVLHHLGELRATHAAAEASDAELLGRFADRHEEAAFTGLLLRHGPMVWAVSRRVLPDVQDAEDVFQASFLLLARRAASIRKRESVGSWLHGVTHRLALKARARAARRQVHEKRAADMRDTNPRSGAVRQDIQEALDRALQDLPERYRSALVLCYLEGKSHEAAARQLGCPLATLRSRVARGRELLRARLVRHGLTLSAAGLAALLMASTAPAAVPHALAKAALTAALPFAAGQAAATLCTARVAELVEGGLRTMVFGKAKMAVVVLAVGLLAGAGALAHGGRPAGGGNEPTKTAPQEKAAAPARDARPPATGRHEVGDVAVSGQVLGPDGKPFAGARLFLAPWGVKKEDLKMLATTGADGRFRAAVPAAAVSRGAKLVAVAKDHGPDWVWLGEKKTDDFTLRLVRDDVPVAGRVLDLEGRPVADVSVGVLFMQEVDLKPWLADPKHGDLATTGKRYLPTDLGGPSSVKTDKDGRFRLTGFGRDRVAHLQIRGAGVEDADVEVVTRAGKVDGLRLESRAVYPPGANFTVRPSKPIAGTVRDKTTGKPIAGIRVVVPNATWTWARATTDEKGHYKIDGVGKQKEYTVAAGGQLYFNATKTQIADTQGLDPLVVDLELAGGIAVRGRLTDKATGKPVRGHVTYGPLVNNPNVKDFPGPSAVAATDSGGTDEDGWFTVLTVPGPGLLAARADDADHYRSASAGGVRTTYGLEAGDYQAFARINPDPKDEKSLRCDIAVEPGRTLDGKVVGPDGKPLAGARVAGLHQRYQFGEKPEKLAGDSFTVAGFGPADPHVLVFAHPEKKLARVEFVPAGQKGPLTVRLEPTGALAGRVLDGGGKPLAGATVQATYSFGQTVAGRGGKGRLPVALRFEDGGWPGLLNGQALTDKDGRFRITGLAPGLKYGLQAPGVERRDLSVQPGKDNDLGDLK